MCVCVAELSYHITLSLSTRELQETTQESVQRASESDVRLSTMQAGELVIVTSSYNLWPHLHSA